MTFPARKGGRPGVLAPADPSLRHCEGSAVGEENRRACRGTPKGARFIRKNIQDLVSDPLAEKIIAQNLSSGAVITADVKGDEVMFTTQQTQIPVPA